MEIARARRPCFAVKGQGGRLALLQLTALLWTLGGCQLSSSDPPSPSPQPAVTEFPRDLLRPSFLFDSALSAGSPTTHLLADLSTSEDSGSYAEGSETSVFVVPSVTFFSTPAYSHTEESSFSPDLETWSSFLASSDAAENVESGSHGLTIQTTTFLDSVAPSLRWNPVEENLGWTSSFSPLQTLASVESGTGAPAVSASVPEEHSSTELVVSTATWSVSDWLTPTPSDSPSLPSTDFTTHLLSASVYVSPLPTSSDMLDILSTQSAGSFHSVAGEMTSPFMSSVPGVTSPGPEKNTSCPDEPGCIKYGEEEEEEEGRIKIIVGVACGAILLVVLVGVLIGCFLRRRGKMTSGSKVDLSSYWDDSVTLSYINGQLDIPEDSADEMISLDNDSFLNSLDSMSFTNTWTSDTSTSKHTNF